MEEFKQELQQLIEKYWANGSDGFELCVAMLQYIKEFNKKHSAHPNADAIRLRRYLK